MFNNIFLSCSFNYRSIVRQLPSILMQVLLLPALLLFFVVSSYAASTPESKLPTSGRVVVTGSVPLANLISLWADDFSYRNPDISITVADAGSAVGVEALLNGSADSVLTDIALSREEEARFIDRFGYAPTLVPVAMDGVAVYVSSLNPLQQISIKQLDAIYSANQLCGAEQPFTRWEQLGVKGELSKNQITALGLTVASGAYVLFKHVALCDGGFHENFQALAGPAAVVWALSDNRAAIGFASSARHLAGIHALSISPLDGGNAVLPTFESIQSGSYPLARVLSIVLNIAPSDNADKAVQAFVDYARSTEGQAVTTEAGYVPLPIVQ